MFNRSKYLDLLLDRIAQEDGHIFMEKLLNRLSEYGFKDDSVKRDTAELIIVTGKRFLTTELIYGSYIELFTVLHAMKDCGIEIEIRETPGQYELLEEAFLAEEKYDVELVKDILKAEKMQNSIKVVSGMGKIIEHIIKVHLKGKITGKDWREADKIDKIDDAPDLLGAALEKSLIDEIMYRRLIRIFNDRDRFIKTTRGTRREIPTVILEEYINSQMVIVIDLLNSIN